MEFQIFRTNAHAHPFKSDCITCFECDELVRKKTCFRESFYGVVIINGKTIKFHYSPMGNDGNIGSNATQIERTFIKRIVPLWILFETDGNGYNPIFDDTCY
jgi:hypothetical protein